MMTADILRGAGAARDHIHEDSVAVANTGARRTAGLPRSQRGFTLLELLVVLALVGLVAAIAFPNLERLYGAVTRETERDYILDQFAGLGLRAMRQGRNFVVFDSVGPSDPDSPDPTGFGAVSEAAGGAGPDPGSTAPAGYTPYAIEVPGGWETRLDPPLRILANGVCLGASLTLYYQGEAEPPIDLDPPWCRVEPDA